MVEVTIFLAFIAGLLSFLSPCVLPLIPAFLAYMSGVSSDELAKNKASAKRKIFINSVFFVLGFSFVFALLGVLINSILSSIGYDLKLWAGRVGGIIIVLFGLYLLGILKIPYLDREHKFKTLRAGPNYVSSLIFGATFAAGWTPCVGAILGTIFTVAITEPSIAFYLLLAYSIGLGIPFLLVGLFTEKFYSLISLSEKLLKYFNIIAGILLILIGILVFTGTLGKLANIPFFTEFLLKLGA